MRIQPLESTDGFLLFDLDAAERSAGVVRLAPKVLHDSAELLARSVTYTFASFGVKAGGASAGLNAKPDGRDAAIAAFVEEVAPTTRGGALVLHAGTGLADSDLAGFGVEPLDAALLAHGALAAASGLLGTLEGKTVAVAGGGHLAYAAQIAAADRGATVADDTTLETPADVLLVAGKAGVIDHEVAPAVKAEVVVPLTPVPVTAKAFAAFRRAGVVYVPDFIALAAPLLAAFDPQASAEPVERVRDAVTAIAGDGVDLGLTAIATAEAFLSSWQESRPFGRPLA